jgi:hypothetical protein
VSKESFDEIKKRNKIPWRFPKRDKKKSVDVLVLTHPAGDVLEH